MIRGMHGLFFNPEAEAVREFFRDKLGFDYVDAGEGWLIFNVPEAEFGVHPGDDPHQQFSFWCDDIEDTIKTLEAKGVVFTSPVQDLGFGLVTTFEIPGGAHVQLYQPHHAQP